MDTTTPLPLPEQFPAPNPTRVCFDKPIAQQELFSISLFTPPGDADDGQFHWHDISDQFDGSVCIDSESLAVGLKDDPGLPDDEVQVLLIFSTGYKLQTAALLVEDHISLYLKIAFGRACRQAMLECIIQRGGYHLASLKPENKAKETNDAV